MIKFQKIARFRRDWDQENVEEGLGTDYPLEIKANGAQTIDGNSSVFLESPYGALNLYTDGTSKYFIF